ncbi:hypothetical protein, partial [Nocardia rhamnosiphila]|uniref:hypothetical protein n=1 Tax=Nocardia rhamnosiphila TaxID=426716 RepID=UPI001C3FED1F
RVASAFGVQVGMRTHANSRPQPPSRPPGRAVLLARCPGVTVLVTSRARLVVPFEQVCCIG